MPHARQTPADRRVKAADWKAFSSVRRSKKEPCSHPQTKTSSPKVNLLNILVFSGFAESKEEGQSGHSREKR
jgi:hypothetical protein